MDTAWLTRNNSIVDESRKILSEMKNEITSLEDRVRSLEKENAEKNLLKEQLDINQNLNDKLLSKLDEERRDTHKNVFVLSDLINELKSPVHQVVDNLQDWSASFADGEMRHSFDECLATARKVLTSFTKVEHFCGSMRPEEAVAEEHVDLRTNLKKSLTLAFDDLENIKLFIDKNIPGKVTLNTDLLYRSLKTVIQTLLQADGEKRQVMISILKKNSQDPFQEEQLKLLVRVMSDNPTDITWKEDWYDSVDTTGDKKNMLPLEWLEIKNMLRNKNGNLFILASDGKVTGSEIHLPLKE